jgi:Tol biopolymer transport system component
VGGLATAGVSWLVLLTAIQAGLSVPSEEALSPLARLGALDYSLGQTGAFASLREEFIEDVLGDSSSDSPPEPPPAPPRRADAVPVVAAPPDPAPRPEVGRPPRTTVEHEFDNDNFQKAYPVESIPFTATTGTSSASRETGEPSTCDPLAAPGGTVWYRYTPRANLGLIANTYGTDYPVTLAVFTGETLDGLTQLDCDYNEGGNAQVVFPGEQQQPYFFQVTASAGGGHLEFSLDPLGRTDLVSVSMDGTGSDNRGAGYGSVSETGRYVAFQAAGDNLVPGDTNMCWWSDPVPLGSEELPCQDVFVRDMKTGRTERVSVSSDEEQASGTAGESLVPAISGDGRYVAFASDAPNLVSDDQNAAVDIFVRDLKKGRTERVSVSSVGKEGQLSESWHTACRLRDEDGLQEVHGYGEGCWFNNHHINTGVSISSDARYVVFSSHLHGLVPGVPECTDTGSLDLWNLGVSHPYLHPVHFHGADAGWLSCRQIYVHDRKTDRTTLASVSSSGEPAIGDSSSPYIARGGRWIVFASDAANLAPVVTEDGSTRPDSNGKRDAFVHDLRTGTTELVSLSSDEEQGLGESGGHGVRGHVAISDSGRWVAFISTAHNLAPGDLNTELDVFLRDRRSGRTQLLSPGPGESGHASISADGRYVTLTYPQDPGTVEPDHPLSHTQDLLVYDRVTGTVTRISVDTSGHEANGQNASEPEISADGHFVVFHSDATNLDDLDTDPYWDVFVHELPWTR